MVEPVVPTYLYECHNSDHGGVCGRIVPVGLLRDLIIKERQIAPLSVGGCD